MLRTVSLPGQRVGCAIARGVFARGGLVGPHLSQVRHPRLAPLALPCRGLRCSSTEGKAGEGAKAPGPSPPGPEGEAGATSEGVKGSGVQGRVAARHAFGDNLEDRVNMLESKEPPPSKDESFFAWMRSLRDKYLLTHGIPYALWLMVLKEGGFLSLFAALQFNFLPFTALDLINYIPSYGDQIGRQLNGTLANFIAADLFFTVIGTPVCMVLAAATLSVGKGLGGFLYARVPGFKWIYTKIVALAKWKFPKLRDVETNSKTSK